VATNEPTRLIAALDESIAILDQLADECRASFDGGQRARRSGCRFGLLWIKARLRRAAPAAGGARAPSSPVHTATAFISTVGNLGTERTALAGLTREPSTVQTPALHRRDDRPATGARRADAARCLPATHRRRIRRNPG